jgi:hypothetical protein
VGDDISCMDGIIFCGYGSSSNLLTQARLVKRESRTPRQISSTVFHLNVSNSSTVHIEFEML